MGLPLSLTLQVVNVQLKVFDPMQVGLHFKFLSVINKKKDTTEQSGKSCVPGISILASSTLTSLAILPDVFADH